MSQKRLLALAACTFGLSILAAFASRAPAAPLPALAADKLAQDFGTLRQGETVAAEFELVNQSDVSVRIVHVINSCDCTLSEWSREPLPPGEATTLRTTWHTLASRGEVLRTLDVMAHREGSPQQEILQLRLTGTVDPEYIFDPEEIEFQAGQAGKVFVRFRPNRAASVSIKDCYCTNSAFSAHLLAEDEIEVAFDPAKWIATSSDVGLVVYTTNERAEQCRVPIRVN